ncbi:hypothetical protein ALC62_09596 [Cyphomyrmex costatus]|uniref:Uncharacterized protein n=1 Tax=Cyphomyrmex costatus TaxID=456900 RepID=A0A151IFK5_9HYME|nr:hypothetical protein ALC62_09596 [Cyphomyrmex costatus]
MVNGLQHELNELEPESEIGKCSDAIQSVNQKMKDQIMTNQMNNAERMKLLIIAIWNCLKNKVFPEKKNKEIVWMQKESLKKNGIFEKGIHSHETSRYLRKT